MTESIHAIIVRLPIAAYRKLQALAAKERRPVSHQALYIIEKALAVWPDEREPQRSSEVKE